MNVPSSKILCQVVAGVLVSLLLITSPGIRLPGLDSQADQYFAMSIQQATVAYATCRVVNGSVSVLKESDLQLQPAGVGLSLAIGQALDPIDDMVERASDVLVTSITSLGLQKLIYEMAVTQVPGLLGVLLLMLSFSLFFSSRRVLHFQRGCVHLMILFLVARMCLPLSSLANDFLNDQFFEPEITAAQKELALGVEALGTMLEVTLPEIDGLRGTVDNSVAFVKIKAVEFKEGLGALVVNAGNLVDNLIKLTFLYIGIFLVQVILLPLAVFWLMLKLLNLLFKPLHPLNGIPHLHSPQTNSTES